MSDSTGKTAILLLDFQNEFVCEGGKLHQDVSELIHQTGLMNKVPPLVKRARNAGAKIIYAPVYMDEQAKFTGETNDPYAFMQKDGLFTSDTWNSAFAAECLPEKDDIVLKGRTNFNAFQGTNLEKVLKDENVTRLFVGGFMTNVCVLDTIKAASELDLDMQRIVLLDGCAAKTVQEHFHALNTDLPRYCYTATCEEAEELIVSKRVSTSQNFNKARRRFSMFDQVKLLRLAMIEKWVAGDRFIRFLDRDGNGTVDYDEFYDFLHQFGLVQETGINPAEVFDMLDTNAEGIVNVEDLKEALAVRDDDIDLTDYDDIEQLPPFPTDLLVGLVAHNNMKPSMMKFVHDNLSFFRRVKLVTTGSTGRALSSLSLGVEHLVSSGPLGGDQEIGGLITEGRVAAVFFFTDPLSAHPHAPDIAALNRICCVHDTMFANNPATAKALVWSLEHSVFGYSRLTGFNPELGQEGDVVAKYKEGQQKVIQSVSAK